jgi:Xaa-Pro aminopeptidase
LYKQTEFGDFLQLEPLTLVPFDLDGINKDELTVEEKTKLNNYHKLVFNTVSKYLNKAEVAFLKKYTKAI